MPDAECVVVNHFDVKETATVPRKINTRLKRKLTEDELCECASSLGRLKRSEKPGDTYWWYASKHGMSHYPHLLFRGVALVRNEVIVACVRTSVLVGSFIRYTQNPLERWVPQS